MKAPIMTALTIVAALLFTQTVYSAVVYDFQSIKTANDYFSPSQQFVDTRWNFDLASDIAGGLITAQHYNGFGNTSSQTADVAPGVTQLLTFAAPPRLVGLVVSGLFSSNRTALSGSLGEPMFGQLIAYDSDGRVVLDTIIRGSQNGMAFIDFEGLVDNISLLTLSTGGGLAGLDRPGRVAGFIVQVPEPGAFLLVGMGLLMVAGARRKKR